MDIHQCFYTQMYVQCTQNGYNITGPYRNILQETCRMTYFNILHILQENHVFLLKYLAKCKRNGHHLARPCMNLTNQHLQDFLQVLQLCKILGLCRILLAWIVQESCKISVGSVARRLQEHCKIYYSILARTVQDLP